MRVWAEVYDTSGVKVAFIESIISANAASRLDEAGTFDLQCALQQDVIDYLVSGNEIALYAQEDTETPVQWTRGKIVKPRIQETGDNLSISISGRDLMDELRMKVVGLGRSYNAQTVEIIMDDLVGLVSGWTADVETASASLLQTARFDGAKVLKAILQSTKQLGLHIRNGTVNRTLEIGAFGTAATTANGEAIWAMRAPSSITPEFYSNNTVLVIDTISVTDDLDPSVNWAIPMGAGEGTAATTLKDTSYEILNTDNTVYRAGTTPTYPIYIRTNDFDIDEYYIDASDGDDQRQDTLSFKTIGPIANSSTAKQLASDALADACMASLARTRVALTSYTLTVRKLRVDIRPGDLIHVQYKGVVPTTGDPKATRSTLTYIDVDEDLWVMGMQRSASENGFITTLQVSTVDRHVMDDTDIMVEVLDRSEVQNLTVQTFPFGFQDSSERVIQGASSPSDAQYKTANFSLKVPDFFTEVIRVDLQLVTRPLYSMTDVGAVLGPLPEALKYYYAVYPSTNYPCDITITIDGVDRTTALGGPWNASAGNSAVDVTLDISEYIVDAVGGLYQNHTIVFAAGYKAGEVRVNTSHPSEPAGNASNGVVEAKTLVFGMARAIF
jgi:hypothetical protein